MGISYGFRAAYRWSIRVAGSKQVSGSGQNPQVRSAPVGAGSFLPEWRDVNPNRLGCKRGIEWPEPSVGWGVEDDVGPG